MIRIFSVCWTVVGAGVICLALLSCGQPEKKDRDFHTSGSPEADQRAEQRVIRDQQLRGEGTDASSKKAALFERLGGEAGMKTIVDDFVTRAIADPRVNWERKGVASGGVLGVGKKSREWQASPAAVEQMKKHIVQFLSLATGGPAHYDGKEMQATHAGMRITNSEFDATIGDLKATLDAKGVAIDEQKELLAVVESVRPQVVEER
ncbi:MAG: group 1 truncated hemoglobin [Burkholderiales bacterium]|nr:group 1 truncated hemoglobin [Phycisphaerae bacterium]